MNVLQQNILDKDLDSLEKNLNNCTTQTLVDINHKCESFKTLAIRTLNDSEFERFCKILKNYYAKNNLELPSCNNYKP